MASMDSNTNFEIVEVRDVASDEARARIADFVDENPDIDDFVKIQLEGLCDFI